MKLHCALARYDRTNPLFDGTVAVPGVDIAFSSPPLETIFRLAFDEGTFEVSELSFSNQLYLTATGKSRYVSLPIFPSRMFRHSALFIRTDRGIRTPRDLRGRKVGVREYSMTAAVAARGMLADEYGVGADTIQWLTGPADAGDEKPVIRMAPRGVDVSCLPDGRNLSDMLASGELDAMVAYKPPACVTAGAPNVGRLFPDHRPIEEDYVRRTGIFPIMHLIGVRRDVVARHPELPLVLCAAFEAAKQTGLAVLSAYQALAVGLPWAPAEMARTRAVFGGDPWVNGVERNRQAITAMARWSFEQGLADRVLRPKDIFEPSTLSWEPAA
jgi:4,5-dihydroxyphthalate decarboxylase